MALTDKLTAIADAIRAKTGEDGGLTLEQMPAEISNIQGGQGKGFVTEISEGVDATAERIISVGTPVFSVTAEDYNVPATYTSACYTPPASTATSLTGTIVAKAWDWVLATVTTRSEATYPEDWTLLHESGYVTASDGTNQKMAFLCRRTETAGTVSFTVEQVDTARIYINLLAVSDCDGFVYHDGTEYLTTVATEYHTVPRPAFENLIWGCSAVSWTSSATNGQWSCSEISDPVVDLGTEIASRQANFFDNDDGTSREFVSASGGGTQAIIDCVEVMD